MKNLFRSDSAMGNEKFVWQQPAPGTEPEPEVEKVKAEDVLTEIKELGDETISENEKLKTTTKTTEELEVLEANENNSEAPLMAAARRVNELITKYLQSGAAEDKLLEKDVMDAIYEAVGGSDQEDEIKWL